MTTLADPADLPGLPAAAVRAWLAANCPQLEVPSTWQVQIISGGLSNITYRLQWGQADLVLRRGPVGHALPGAHDMHREYRVLQALWPTAVPVPETLAFCSDPDIVGAPFYVMHEVAGVVLRDPADTQVLTVDQRGQVSEELITVLATLHSIDPDSVGLENLGRKGGYAARQINTWGKQWARSRTRDLPDMDALLDRLTGALPPDRGTTIVHGDYRLDNTIVRLDGRPRIAAVLDWELSTLGDPLADLALMLTYWHDLGDTERSQIAVAAGLTDFPGFPTTAELAGRYAALTGRSIDDLPFYQALASMKLAVILEGVHARHLEGHTVGGGHETVAASVPLLVSRGLRLLQDESVDLASN